VIGVTFCTNKMAPRIAATVDHILSASTASELKWQKVTRKSLPMYEHIVTAYFQMLDKGFLKYYCLVIDTSKVNNKLFNGGDKELGFTKFVFTLLYKFARQYGYANNFYCFLDHRVTKHDPDTMKRALNAKSRKDARKNVAPYRLVTYTHSDISRIIQLTDIVTGAIAYETNMRHLSLRPAPHKVALMKHVANKANVATLATPTQIYGEKFDIWHMDFDAEIRRKLHPPRRR